jgi:hypothetical protein
MTARLADSKMCFAGPHAGWGGVHQLKFVEVDVDDSLATISRIEAGSRPGDGNVLPSPPQCLHEWGGSRDTRVESEESMKTSKVLPISGLT